MAHRDSTERGRGQVVETLRLLSPHLGGVKRTQFATVVDQGLPQRPTDRSDRELELSWCAGVFDGEGSVYLLKHGTHAGYVVLEAGITQSSWDGVPEVLGRFQSFFGIGKTYGPYDGGAGYAPVYRWKAHRRQQIVDMIEALRPQLGPVKMRQAETAIAIAAAQPTLPRGNPAWGDRKTQCVNGHDYTFARIRPFRGRGKSVEPPRPSKQCLACVRESARRHRERTRNGAAE